MIFHMYKIILCIDEKVIIISVHNSENTNWCINVIISITEFVIYRNYIKFMKNTTNNYAKTRLWKELKKNNY